MAWGNEGIEESLTKMTNTSVKGEGKKGVGAGAGLGWENKRFSLNTLGLKCHLIIENILSPKKKRQICKLEVNL